MAAKSPEFALIDRHFKRTMRHTVLGGGDDAFTWNPGDGSDTIEGQAGSDLLQFNGANAAEIMAASRAVLVPTRAVTSHLLPVET